MKIPHTFVDRTWNATRIFERANAILTEKNPQAKLLVPLSQVIKERKMKLLGHIIRIPDPKDPMVLAAIDENLDSIEIELKRVGKPRFLWTNETMEHAWDFMEQHEAHPTTYKAEDAQKFEIVKKAIDRAPPFEKTQNEKLHEKREKKKTNFNDYPETIYIEQIGFKRCLRMEERKRKRKEEQEKAQTLQIPEKIIADVNSDDPYKILGVTRYATTAEITMKYKRLALKYHPDKHKNNKDVSEKIFKKLGNAYETLKNPASRRKFDMSSR